MIKFSEKNSAPPPSHCPIKCPQKCPVRPNNKKVETHETPFERQLWIILWGTGASQPMCLFSSTRALFVGSWKIPDFQSETCLDGIFDAKQRPPFLDHLVFHVSWILIKDVYYMGHISQQSNFFFKTLIGSKNTLPLPTSHWNPLKEAPAPPLSLTSRPLLLKLEECDSRQRVIFLSPAWVIFFKTIYLADVAVCRIQTKTKYNPQNPCCLFCICMNI